MKINHFSDLKVIQPKIFLIGLLMTLVLSISGCDVIGGIFKTGVGVGAFVVVLIVVLIVAFIMRGRRRG